jgi:ubiquinone/menaquinone biosynthesis C-methylase UbiE
MEDISIQREKQFHELYYKNPENRDAKTRGFYSITASVNNDYRDYLFQNCTGATILEYGCGTGSYAFTLSHNGAQKVVGIDISEVAIEQATEKARKLRCADRASFLQMNAESLQLSADSFDIVCGTSILHHLDLNKALASITQVLHKEGKAIFIEPLGHNSMINLYRRLTPSIRSADEHPLLRSDFALIGQYFNKVEISYYYLSTLLAVPLAGLPGFNKLVAGLETLDRTLFKMPLLSNQAWIALIKLQQPVK